MNQSGLLSQSATLRLLSLLFQPPAPGRAEELRRLSAVVLEQLRIAARELADKLAAEDGAEYHRILGSAGRCRDCASDYATRSSIGAKIEVARVASLYESFGFPGAHELAAPADSAAAELSFAGYLLLEQAYAQSRGDREAEAQTRACYRLFADEHLRWLPAFLDSLGAAAGEAGPYAAAAQFARAALDDLGLLGTGEAANAG